jgi:hypothetical protein
VRKSPAGCWDRPGLLEAGLGVDRGFELEGQPIRDAVGEVDQRLVLEEVARKSALPSPPSSLAWYSNEGVRVYS